MAQTSGVTSGKGTGLNAFLEGETDTKRLEEQHPVLKLAMGGRLILAPIDFSRQDMLILDSGASDGTWLLDFRKDLAASGRKHSFVGFDISADRFAPNPPADVSLVAHNLLEPWPEAWVGSFDLVHQRLVMPAAGSGTRDLLRRELDLLKPGGWIQLVEAEMMCGADDGPVMRQFLGLLKSVFKMIGLPEDLTAQMRPWLEQEGCINVGDCIIPYCLGAKCTDPILREQSVLSALPGIVGLVGMIKSFGSDTLATTGMTSEELDSLASRFADEIRKQGAYWPFRVVWAQKLLR